MSRCRGAGTLLGHLLGCTERRDGPKANPLSRARGSKEPRRHRLARPGRASTPGVRRGRCFNSMVVTRVSWPWRVRFTPLALLGWLDRKMGESREARMCKSKRSRAKNQTGEAVVTDRRSKLRICYSLFAIPSMFHLCFIDSKMPGCTVCSYQQFCTLFLSADWLLWVLLND